MKKIIWVILWLFFSMSVWTNAWAQQLPNLTPYQPPGWSDKIVVTNKTGCTSSSCTDSSSLLPTDKLYVDWAVINNGSASTSARFYTQLYVDGTPINQWYTDPPLDVNYYINVNDYSIGSLSAGTHTIKIMADSTNAISESNENDNQYTKTITVQALQYTLQVIESPSGSGSVSISPNKSTYSSGEQVTLTAKANPGYTFSNWGGGVASGTTNPITITMNADTAVIAYFAQNINPSGPPKISASPMSLNFGNQNVASTSQKTITILNNGNSDLIISSTSNSGTNPSDFNNSNNCTTISVNNSCTLTVTFAPTSQGRKSATLWITSNDPKKPTVKVRLSGNAICTYSVSSSSQQCDASGGTWSVNVATPSGCSWTAISKAPWITITSGSSGSGTETVNYEVAANTGTRQRTGRMTIAKQTFTVTQSGSSSPPPPTQKPNLTPYQPSGWSDKIVVTNKTGCTSTSCTDSSPLLPTDTLYVDWAVINNGSASTSARFYVQIYVDSASAGSWYFDPPLDANHYTHYCDLPIGSLSAGTHTIKVVADSTNVIDESNENDNSYTKTITVGSTGPTISSLSTNSATPFSLLTITGSGFDTTTQLSVDFFDNNQFDINILPLTVSPTSIIVSVPPFINGSGEFAAGTVNVKVAETSQSVTINSNSVSGFSIQDLPPAPQVPPGSVTLAFLNGVINYSNQIVAMMPGTSDFKTALSDEIITLKGIVPLVQGIVQGSSSTATLGTFNGTDIIIDSATLANTDRIFIGMLESLANSQASVSDYSKIEEDYSCQSPQAPCQSVTNRFIGNSSNMSSATAWGGYLMEYGACLANTTLSDPDVAKMIGGYQGAAGFALAMLDIGFGTKVWGLTWTGAAVLTFLTSYQATTALMSGKTIEGLVKYCEDTISIITTKFEAVGSVAQIFMDLVKICTLAAPTPTCQYGISPASMSINKTGGPGDISVTATSGCYWEANSFTDWISVNSPLGFTSGNQHVNFEVDSNIGYSQRIGCIMVAGSLNFTVTQSAQGPCATPGGPSGPNPPNGASGVPTYQGLSWTATSNTDSYDVYLGTSMNPPFVTNVTVPSYVPSASVPLIGGTTYYWKIVAKNNCGNSTAGAVWSFSTSSPPPCLSPGAPSGPSPSNGTTGVSTSTTLSWAATSNTNSYDVYFGTSSPPPLAGNTTSTSYSVSGVTAGSTYYWKIVAKNNCGNSTSGPVWSFSTGCSCSLDIASTSCPPDPYGIGLGDAVITGNACGPVGAALDIYGTKCSSWSGCTRSDTDPSCTSWTLNNGYQLWASFTYLVELTCYPCVPPYYVIDKYVTVTCP